jgi:hypothetical protein
MATEVWLCALHNSLSFSLANDAIIYSRFDIVLAATREPFLLFFFRVIVPDYLSSAQHIRPGLTRRSPVAGNKKKKEEENCSFSSSLITPTRQRPTDRPESDPLSFFFACQKIKKERKK